MKRKTLVMNVDYFDELSLHEGGMGPEHVEALVRQCAERGVDVVNWRAVGLGIAGYPSRLLSADGWELPEKGKERERFPVLGGASPEQRKARLVRRRMHWGDQLAQSLRKMDPIAVARDACRRHGVAFFIWMDPIDEMFNVFLLQHPEWLVLGRDGKTPWPGLRSYGHAGARANALDVVEELLAYRPDGLYLSMSCHTRHWEILADQPEDFFGFEPSVRESYRKRVGRDMDDGTFDEEAWHQSKGDGFTEYFRQVKRRAASAGVKLALGTQFGPHMIFTCPPFSKKIPYRYAVQWQRWVDEGIADILVLGDYEWTWDFHPICEAKGFPIEKGRYAADLFTREYVDYAAGRAACWLFSSWLSAYAQHHQGASAGNLADAMRMRSRTLLATAADGICLHEAHTFEHYRGFDTVSEMRRTLEEAASEAIR